MKRTPGALLLLGILASGYGAWAQTGSLPVPTPGINAGGGFPGWYGGGYSGYFGGGSTAAGSYMSGMANVVQAAGAANLMNSAAANNYQDARSKELDNRMKYTKTFFEQRQMNRMYTAQERGKPLSSDQLSRIAAADAPKRMVDSQLDPITGEINWPTVLRDQRYAAETSQLDTIYRARADAGGVLDGAQLVAATAACEKLQQALQDNMDDYKSWDFLEAWNFLRSLSYAPHAPTARG